MEIRKVYVRVTVEFSKEGKMLPKSLKWEDETVFEIDKVVDVQRAASLKGGGIGMRYTIRIKGKETFLWYEEPSWFVEGKYYNND